MTNITAEHRAAFEAISSGDFGNFALGDVGTMNSLQLGRARWHKQHVAIPKESFRPHAIENRARVNA